MKRVIAILGVLIFLAGCLGPFAPQPGPLISLLGGPGVINRPRVSGTDDWYVQPGAKEWLDFSTGRDQYGNPLGLSDDSQWVIGELHIQCAVRNVEDTVFPTEPNVYYWAPGWTAPIEQISGLPYTPWPLPGYPFDSCADHGVEQMPSQMATITATAKAKWIGVKITLPYDRGQYMVDVPGFTPTSSNVIVLHLGSPGDLEIDWQDGNNTETWTVEIPVDWFWATATFEIPVGPSGVCR